MERLTENIKGFGKCILAMALSVSMLLFVPGCSNRSEDTVKTNAPENTEAEPKGENMVLISEQQTEYTMIYPADSIALTRAIYNDFRTAVRTETDVLIPMKKDSEESVGEYEILIGQTNREASVQAYQKLKENQFSFTLSGKTLVIAATDDACMKLAVSTFVTSYIKDKILTVNTSDFPITYQCKDEYTTVEIDNTADVEGDDPYVVKHNGYYYYCWSDGGVKVTRISNLDAIEKSKGKLVFDRHKEGFESVWAPELHYIDGSWYIYVAMCRGTSDNAQHRMYCLKGTTQDPTDPFELVGQVTDNTNRWAIDGTVFQYKGELYTVWSGWEGTTDGCQKLYIAHMSNPWTIDSKRIMISTPSTWDNHTQNPSVNEGPCVIVSGDTVFVLFSGNGSWTNDYCIGYLTCTDGNLLNADSWVKSSTALLYQTTKIYGPGHCSVVKADDGSYQIIYHANLVSNSGWQGRSVRVQELVIEGNTLKVTTRRALKSKLKISSKSVVGPISD